MVLAWYGYRADLDRVYPMYALSIVQLNDVPSNYQPLDLLPPAITSQLIEVKNTCGVDGLTPRKLSLYTTDGAHFQLTYPQPFSESLAQYLTANLKISAWEFIGEKIKYGRLKKLLDNV